MKKILALIALFAAMASAACAAYPTKPVHLIVPFAAGGAERSRQGSDGGEEVTTFAVLEGL